MIATLGRFAMDFMLDEFDLPEQGQKIGKLHGEVISAQASYGEIAIVPLYHPAAALYNDQLQDVIEDDFQVLRQFFEG